jgi:hypothetical protein
MDRDARWVPWREFEGLAGSGEEKPPLDGRAEIQRGVRNTEWELWDLWDLWDLWEIWDRWCGGKRR